MSFVQSDLPILPSDSTPRSTSERYGALFYLGVAGLAVLLVLILVFASGVWSLRHVWSNIYTLNDPRRPEADRIEAAFALSQNPNVTQRQLWDLSLSRIPPPLARYLLAEALTAEATEADPRGYALAVARSEGWPNWLRLLLLRPLAYAASGGANVPYEPLADLRSHDDPMLAIWATYTLAASRGDHDAIAELRRTSVENTPSGELARMLRSALESRDSEQRAATLDRATLWLRDHHPEAIRIWRGWKVRDGRIERGD